MDLQSQSIPPRAILFDMDGVLFHGDRVIPAALDFVRAIEAVPHLFLTNNPILPALEVVAKLHRMGFSRVRESQVLTSGMATARWLARRRPGFRFYDVGAPGLRQVLEEAGGVADAEAAEFVVIGEGAGLDYDTLTQGVNLIIERGAELIATNPDTTVDSVRRGRRWILPGGGALVAPFQTATGKQATVIGKPNPLLYEMALERLGLRAGHALMIGDRPDTDIRGAVESGLRSALVRTGRFGPGETWPEALPRPDWDAGSLTELWEALGRQWPGWPANRREIL